MRVLVLLTTYYEGVMYRPGAVLEIDERAFIDESGVVQLPRWCAEDRERLPANSPKRPSAWVNYDLE